jgi:hypothetical protein
MRHTELQADIDADLAVEICKGEENPKRLEDLENNTSIANYPQNSHSTYHAKYARHDTDILPESNRNICEDILLSSPRRNPRSRYVGHDLNARSRGEEPLSDLPDIFGTYRHKVALYVFL